MTWRSRSRSAARRIGRALLLVLGSYLVARAVVELATVDPARPETYRQDWGGPSYLGVILVHTGPGALVLVIAGLRVRARSHKARQYRER